MANYSSVYKKSFTPEFYKSARIGSDAPAQLQRDLANEKYFSYTTMPYIDFSNGNHQRFASANRLSFHGHVGGPGLPGELIEKESRLFFGHMPNDYVNRNVDNHLRPFVAMPYLGRGRQDVVLETQLMTGQKNPDMFEMEKIRNKMITDQTSHYFPPKGAPSVQYPSMPSNWVRGGENTRKMKSALK